MKIFPAIDLYQKKAVRLLRGDYRQMTVYSDHPVQVADDFFRCGASYLHVVDLEGARDGSTANIDVVRQIAETGRLHVEIGGGIRSMQTISDYLQAGVFRVILGTAALQQQGFVRQAIREFGAQHIVVGVDMKDGFVAVHGWTEVSQQRGMDFACNCSRTGYRRSSVPTSQKTVPCRGRILNCTGSFRQVWRWISSLPEEFLRCRISKRCGR